MGQQERVIAYIDGFNLYFGLREKGWRRYYWLNIRALVQDLLKPTQNIVCIKYFTARISSGDKNMPTYLQAKMEAKRRRQGVFLEAVETLEQVKIFEGHYLGKGVECKKCGAKWNTHEEKMTDVCMATELIMDAFSDYYDTALVISGDSDLVPPIRAIRTKFPQKRIVVGFPPARVSRSLQQIANASFVIGEAKLRKSMFPEEVKKANGYVLRRPSRWSRNTR